MRASASAFARISPWIAVIAALDYFLHDRLEFGGTSQLIACCVALAIAGALARRRDASFAPGGTESDAPQRALRAGAVLIPASIAPAVLYASLSTLGTPRATFLTTLLPILLGWSILLFLPLARRAGTRGEIPHLVAGTRIVAGIVAATFVAVIVLARLAEHWTSIDEVIYSMQAHLFAQGDYRWQLDSSVQRFFTLPLMAPTAAGPYSQYTPGYPAVLAAFLAFGAPSASGAMLGAVAVVSTYLVGRRYASAFVGVVAAAMLATHFLFLGYAARYLSHVAVMATVTSAAWLLLTPSSASPRRRYIEGVLAGFLIGVAVTIRPVTGLALGLSLWFWLLSSRGWRATRDTTLLLGMGVAIPCAVLLLYDSYTNGSPFRLGYTAAQGHLNDLGFGMRGLLLYDAQARRVIAAHPFTFVDALRNEVGSVLLPLMRDVTPAFSALPLIAIAYAYRLRPRWAPIAAFAVLPVANFFYFENGVRLYVELLPFAAVGAALIEARVWESDVTAGRALAIFLVGASVASSATSAAAAERDRSRHPSDDVVVTREILAARRTHGPMLVFVRNPPLAEPLFVGLSHLNFSPFPGPVVVARDLGAANASLICRLPGRVVMVAEAATDAHVARLLPTQPDAAHGASCRAPSLSTLTRIRG